MPKLSPTRSLPRCEIDTWLRLRGGYIGCGGYVVHQVLGQLLLHDDPRSNCLTRLGEREST